MKYSVIIAYYKGCSEDENKLITLLNTLVYQEYDDFEVLVVHDGVIPTPLLFKDYKSLNVRFLCTDNHYNKFGHPSRSLGIKESKGDFLLITNHDNTYNTNMFKHLDTIIKPDKIGMYILNVRMVGMRYADGKLGYDEPRDAKTSIILTGEPVEIGNIDIMQVVIRKDVWNSVGGWNNNAADSDGVLIKKMSKNYKLLQDSFIMGEHN